MGSKNIKEVDREKVSHVWKYECDCGETFHYFKTEDQKYSPRFNELCECGCDRCRSREMVGIPPRRFFKKKKSTNLDMGTPSIQGKMLPPDQRREYSRFLGKELKTVNDVREFDKNNPDMVYSAGEDYDDVMNERTKEVHESVQEFREEREDE